MCAQDGAKGKIPVFARRSLIVFSLRRIYSALRREAQEEVAAESAQILTGDFEADFSCQKWEVIEIPSFKVLAEADVSLFALELTIYGV